MIAISTSFRRTANALIAKAKNERRCNARDAHASEPIEPSSGARMSDGTIYAGISPDTNKPMYAMPADAPLTMTFNEAADYAKKLNREKYLGHDDWHVPTKAELNLLFNSRAAGISPDTNKPMYAIPADAPYKMTFCRAREYAQEENAQNSYDHGDWHVPTRNELNVLFNNRAAIGGFNETGKYPHGCYWSATDDTPSYAWGQSFSNGSAIYCGQETISPVRLVRTDAPRVSHRAAHPKPT